MQKFYQRVIYDKDFSSDSIHNNYHTRKQGYAGALVSAHLLAGYVSELLVNAFGRDWLEWGKFDSKFIGKGVQQGKIITCYGWIERIAPDAAGFRCITLAIRMEKDDGTIPVIGSASCLQAV